MCGEKTIESAEETVPRNDAFTRRAFNAMAAGAGLAMLLPRVADAHQTVGNRIEISAPDDAVVRPAAGLHPGLLDWPDTLDC